MFSFFQFKNASSYYWDSRFSNLKISKCFDKKTHFFAFFWKLFFNLPSSGKNPNWKKKKQKTPSWFCVKRQIVKSAKKKSLVFWFFKDFESVCIDKFPREKHTVFSCQEDITEIHCTSGTIDVIEFILDCCDPFICPNGDARKCCANENPFCENSKPLDWTSRISQHCDGNSICKIDHFVNREFERGQGYICADAQASVYSKLTYTCKQHDPLYTIGKNYYSFQLTTKCDRK